MFTTTPYVLPSSTAIPALQPIVHDLFVLRGSNKADAGKELDTQKEVVVSMLLRLVQHHQVHAKRRTQMPRVQLFFLCFTCASTCVIVCLGAGDVHPCAAAVSQREWGQVEASVETDCWCHTSHDRQAAGRKTVAGACWWSVESFNCKPVMKWSGSFKVCTCCVLTDAPGLSGGFGGVKHSVWNCGALLPQASRHAAQEYVYHPGHNGKTQYLMSKGHLDSPLTISDVGLLFVKW